jgi:hypothetical protein
LVATSDSPDNEVDLLYSEDNSSLNISMKKPFDFYGDADTLMKLGLYRVSEREYANNIPAAEEIYK